MQPMTMRDLLTQSLKLIGVTPGGQKPTVDQLTDALFHANIIADTYNNDGQMIFTQQFLVAPLANGQLQSDGTTIYTIGPRSALANVSFDVPARPQALEAASFRQMSAFPFVDIPITILSAEEWAAIRSKNIYASISTGIYMDEQYPIANIYLWPIPNYQASLFLTFWQPLNSSMTLDTVFSMPPGYAGLFLYDTAIAMAPTFNKEASPSVIGRYNAMKREVMWTNLRPNRLVYGSDCQGTVARSSVYDINTDTLM
jgi:hypothetical protein